LSLVALVLSVCMQTDGPAAALRPQSGLGVGDAVLAGERWL
jgi:hypothetical protein